MSKGDIKLSPKYGLNPAMLQCPVCHKDMGIALCGKLKGDAEAPKVMNGGLCDDCKQTYAVVYEASPTKRLTGRMAYVKKEALAENFRKHDELLMLEEDFDKMFVNKTN